MKQKPYYSHILTDTDLRRIQNLIAHLDRAIMGIFSERQLAPVEGLETVPTLPELLYHELISHSESDMNQAGEAYSQ